MSVTAVVVLLLLLSFVGTQLVRGRSTSGLPSGVEYLGLGFAVGPHALGLVDRDTLAALHPLVEVAIAWLLFIVGLDFGRVGSRRARPLVMVLGVAGATATGVAVAAAVYWATTRFGLGGLDRGARRLLAVGSGIALAETTRIAIRWVVTRAASSGPIGNFLIEMASADDLAPVLALGALFAVMPHEGAAIALAWPAWLALTVALGAVLGLVAAVLLRDSEGTELWAGIFGTLLFAVGLSWAAKLSTLLVTCVVGMAMALASPARAELRAMVAPTERAVLLPVLLLAGIRIDLAPFDGHRSLWLVLAVGLAVRVLAKWAVGQLMRALSPELRGAGASLGLGMVSLGPVAISAAYAFAGRFPGTVGDFVLVLAVAGAVLGEIASPVTLHRVLVRAGESGRATAAEPPTTAMS